METVAEEPLRAMYRCKFQISFLFLCHFIFYLFIVGNVGITAGLSFEAGAQTYCPVVSHSISGTLIPIFGSVFSFFLCTILFFTYCPFSFNILLFKGNLRELQPCLKNAGNSVSECFPGETYPHTP